MDKKLSPKIWLPNDELKPAVRQSLLGVVDLFLSTVNVDFPVHDVIIMGSMAGFNYKSESDIDLHIITDFSKVDEDYALVEQLFKAKKTIWNGQHDIRIKGHEVEIYVQDIRDVPISNGIHSIIKEEWIKYPKQRKDIDPVTLKKILSKVDSYQERFEKYYKLGRFDLVEKLLTKITSVRREALEEKGELAPRNLIFKELRRRGVIDKAWKSLIFQQDKELTLELQY